MTYASYVIQCPLTYWLVISTCKKLIVFLHYTMHAFIDSKINICNPILNRSRVGRRSPPTLTAIPNNQTRYVFVLRNIDFVPVSGGHDTNPLDRTGIIWQHSRWRTVVPWDVGLVPVVAGVAGEAHAVGRHVLRLRAAAEAGAPRPAAAVVRAVLRLGAAFALFPAMTHWY